MLSYLKNFVKKNEADIVLVIGVILVALISFGAGRLTSFQADEEPILIQEPLTASIQQSLEPEKAGESGQPEPAEKGKFVGLFDTFRKEKMEKIIEGVKSKLDS